MVVDEQKVLAGGVGVRAVGEEWLCGSVLLFTFTPHSFKGQRKRGLRLGKMCEYWELKLSAISNSCFS